MTNPHPENRRFRMTVAYDGTRYYGWQVQPDQPTVQGTLQDAFERLTLQPVHIMGSGRTDAGVHAKGQVAHFNLTGTRSARQILNACQSYLPRDIRVTAVQETAPDFHAQKSAIGKEYRYFISNRRIQSPFDRLYRLPIKHPLDIESMQRAAQVLVGEHDFASFSANPMREIDGTVRTVYRLNVEKRGSLITIKACGNGFLYKMVRSLAGHLIRVGEGKENEQTTREILESQLRTARVPSARAEGLFLWRVYYPGEESRL